MKRTLVRIAALLGLTLGVSLPTGHTLAATAGNPVSVEVWASFAAPASITATQWQSPAAPAVGGPLSYLIVVNNTGIDTITSLTVVDTLGASPGGSVLMNPVTSAPAGMGAAVVTSTASGTRFVWTGTGLVFGPATSWTFTISGQAGMICAPTAVSNSAWIGATAPGGSAEAFVPVAGGLLTPPPMSVMISHALTGSGAIGSPVTWRIDVGNVGSSTLSSLVVVDTVSFALTGVTTAQPAFMAALPPVNAPSGSVFSWSGTAIPPGLSFSITISGVVGAVCTTTAVGNTAYVVAVDACTSSQGPSNATGFVVVAPTTSLSVAQSLSGGTGLGAPVVFRMVLTNLGTATVTSLTLSDTVSPELVNVVPSQPVPFGAPTVVPSGTATVYGWSMTGLAFAPGQSFTFTLTGNVGMVCSPAVVSATAMVSVDTACVAGPASFVGIPAGVAVAPAIDNLNVFNVVTGGGAPGSPVTYAITVFNGGTSTISGLMVVDTVPPAVRVGFQTPAGALPVAATASGTVYSWSLASLAPGVALTLTLSGTVGEVCAATTIGNTAYWEAGWPCAGLGLSSAKAATFTIPAPTVSLMAGIGQLGVAQVGAASGYNLTIQNTGTATITSLTLTDTIPAELFVTGTVEPGGWAAPVVTSVPGSGTRYVWTNAALVMSPGQLLTFTVNGRFGMVCATAPISNRGFADGTAACGSASSLSPDSPDTLVAHTTGVSVTTWMAPAAPVALGAVSYTIVAVNTGTATIATVRVTDSVSNLVTGAVAWPGPAGFGAPVVSGLAGGGTHFEWSGTGLSWLPGQAYTFTITGTVGTTGVAVTAGTTAYASVSASCAPVTASVAGEVFAIAPTVVLSATLSAGPAVVSTGQSFLVTMDVTNVGAGTGNNASATIWRDALSTGGVSFSGVSAPSTGTLASGARLVFSWTATALSAGSVVFTGTAYTDEDSAGPLSSSAVTIQAAANLSAGPFGVNTTAICSGTTFLVTLPVTNIGQASALGVTASVWLGSGPATAVAWGLPNPAGPVAITGGATQVFSWTVTGLAAGTVTLTATATGLDANSAAMAATAPATTAAVTISTPAVLAAALAVVPAANTGSPVTLTFTVTNTGGSAASSVAISVTTTTGSGTFGTVAPASAGIAPAGTQAYTVSYTPLAAGTHDFSVTASGTSCAVGISAATTGSLVATSPAALSGTLIVTLPGSGITSVGGQVVVTLTVTNTGGATANAVNPSLTPTGAALSAAVVSQVLGGANIAGGAASAWVWSYTVTGAGSLTFAGGANGTDAVSTAPVAVTGLPAGPVTVQTPAALTLAAFSANASTTCVGEAYAVYLRVNNTGQATAATVSPTLWISSGPAQGLPVPAPVAVSIPGGQNVVFTWTITALAGGSVTFTATASGIEGNLGTPVAAGPLAGPTVGVSTPAVLAASLAVPPAANTGTPVTLYFTVTNTGGSAATGVTVSATTTAGSGVFGAPAPASVVLAGGGGAQVFSIAYTPSTAGAHDFSLTATGANCSGFVMAAGLGTVTAASPAALSGTLIVTMPASAIMNVGGLVVVTLTVTNTGGTTANGVVPAALSPAGAAGLLAGPVQVLGGANIAGGAASAWFWTYTVTGAGALTFNTSAAGTDAVTAGAVTTGGKTTAPAVTVQTPATLTAGAFGTSAVTLCAGGTFMVTLPITNSGQATATGVSASVWLASGPASAVAWGLANPGGPVTIAGGTSRVFTWTVTGLAPGSVTLTATATGADANTGAGLASAPATTPGVTVNAAGAIPVSLAVSPTANVSTPVTLTFTVTNTGGTLATAVTVSVTTTTGSGTFGAVAPASAGIAAAGTQAFTVSYTPLTAGTHDFSVTASGTSCAVGISAATTGSLVATSPAALSGTLIVTMPTGGLVTTGGLVVVTLTVTNTGGTTANAVSPSLTPTGVAGTLGGPVQVLGGPNIASGTASAWRWTYTVTGSGTLNFAGGANGTDANTSAVVARTGLPAGPLTVQTPAVLVATSVVSPAAVCVGQPFTVSVTVNNTGQEAASGVTVSLGQVGGAGSALIGAPVPASVASIAGGGSAVLVFSATATGSGGITLSATATGTAAVSGAALLDLDPAVPGVTVNAAAAVTASFGFSVPTASTGQTVQARLVLSNGGGSAASIASLALPQINAGAGSRALTSAASTTLQPAGTGGSVFIGTWNYTPSVAGTHNLTATGTGTTCGTLPVSAAGSANLAVVSPAALSATLIVTVPSGTVVVEGDVVVVTLTVTDTGTAGANFVAPSGAMTPTLPGTLAGPFFLSATGYLTTGTDASWYWTFTPTGGAGTLGFSVAAQGVDENSGAVVTTGVVSSGAAWPIQVQGVAVLTAWMDAPGSVIQGTTATATIWVTNTGGADLTVNPLAISEVDPTPVISPPVGAPTPGTPFVLAAGATQAFKWDYDTVASACGIFWSTAFVDGTENLTGRALGPVYLARMIGVTSSSYSAVVGIASPPRAQVATDSILTFTVYDSCSPPVPVSSVPVTLTIIGGDGRLDRNSGVTGGTGQVLATLRLGNTAGQNVVRADAVGGGSPSTAVTVVGTTRPGHQDYLSQNLFDPKRGQALKIRIFVPGAARVSARIFNLAGELVRTVKDQTMPAGVAVWDWDGRNDSGQYVGNGTYFIQIVVGKDVQLKRVIVLKY